MKAVILAGGKGLRLREVLKDLPKPMAPVAGRPFLEYLVMQLLKWGIRNIILSVGYKGDVIRSHFGDGERLGAKISYSEENEPLGTGGAIKKAAELFSDEVFIAMNGDSFFNVNINELAAFHTSKNAEATLALAFIKDTGRYGRVEYGDEYNVTAFTEKGRDGAGYINGGVYVLTRKAVAEFPEGSMSIENNCMPLLIGNGLFGFTSCGYFIDIGVPADYLQLCMHPAGLLDGVKK